MNPIAYAPGIELMDCVPLIPRGRGQREVLEAIENLVRYYRTNAHRMKYRLFREDRLPIGSGAVEWRPSRTRPGREPAGSTSATPATALAPVRAGGLKLIVRPARSQRTSVWRLGAARTG